MYSIFAVPILEGPPNQIQARRTSSSIAAQPRQRDKSWLTPFVPTDGWELSACKTVTIEGGTIMFRDYQPLDDGYADVYPFTLILNAKPPRSDGTPAIFEGSDKTPIAVRCTKQARLKFDRPLAEGVSRGGLKLEGARLVGDVTIYRPPSALGETDGVSIITSNIQIEPTQVFTLEEVQFAFGKNEGVGRNLRIELERTDQTTRGPMGSVGLSGVSGINRIELASLKKLRLEPTGESPTALQGSINSIPTDQRNSGLLSNSKSPLEVSCEGPFAFDFHTKTATLNDQVQVEQLDQHRDRINCDQLTLQFADATQVNVSTDQSDLTLSEFQAKGSPARVISHSRSTTLSGNQLTYNVAEGKFHATSHHQVVVETPQFQLLSRELNYSVPADGTMGFVDASGPGRLLRPGSDGREPLLVKWQKGLTVRPNGVTQQIIIDGESHVHLGRDISLLADQIELRLARNQNDDRTRQATDGLNRASEHWDPTHVLASGNVSIKTPQLNGTAQHLTATWPDDNRSIVPANGTPIHSNAGATPFPATRHIVARVAQEGWTTVPTAQAAGWTDTPQTQEGWSTVPPVARVAFQTNDQSARGQTNPFTGQAGDLRLAATPQVNQNASNADNDGRKIDFHGEAVAVQLKRVGSETEIADLKIDGNVQVTQTTETRDESSKNTISGTSLRLTPQGNKQQRVQVSGTADQLAKFRSDELNLDGLNIFVDQLANRIWVEGQGKLWLKPSQRLNRPERTASVSATNQPNLEQLGAIKQLDVSWTAGMIFDGRKIYFEDDVAMTAKSAPDQSGITSLSRSFSEGLSIGLTNEVSLASTKSEGSGVNIDQVVLVDNITAEKRVFQLASNNNSDSPFKLAGTGANPTAKPLTTPVVIERTTLDATEQILERQTVIAPQATYAANSGMIQANGPGAIQLHRRGKTKSFDPSGGQSPSKPSDPNAITLTHVKFDDRLIADSNKKQIQIHGQVRSLTSPVRSFDTVFDPDQESNAWPVDAVKLVCEQVQLAQWTPQSSDKPSNEMVATGNAHIINSKFEATADRVSYSQANDMLVVEGTTRSDANLWFRRNPTARPDHLVAGKILYRLSDQWTEVQNVRNVKIKSK